MQYPEHLLKLFHALRKLPGVGTKSAERFAFQMLTWEPHQLQELGSLIASLPAHLQSCAECGCLLHKNGCFFCHHPHRDQSILCILASVKDVFSMEETKEFKGLYHVLGGLLSPLEGKGPESLNLKPLKERIEKLSIKEIIIGLDATLEGDATALFLKKELAPYPIGISRIAFGLPMGSSLEYVDGGTLAKALQGRHSF